MANTMNERWRDFKEWQQGGQGELSFVWDMPDHKYCPIAYPHFNDVIMATKSAIEWTESTWNPVTGCTKISAGCRNCYAERMAMRLKAMGQPNYANGFKPTCHYDALELPLKWKRSQMVFVNSMSDLFHREVPTAFIREIFFTMNHAPWHTFQILTKRAGRLAQIANHFQWTPNVWMGVTVESADYVDRIDHLRQVPAAVRFLSLEPWLRGVSPTNNK